MKKAKIYAIAHMEFLFLFHCLTQVFHYIGSYLDSLTFG